MMKNKNIDNPICLNDEVYYIICSDFALYLAWRLKHNRYDWETDPLHNEDYVRSTCKEEKEGLIKLQKEIEKIKLEFEAEFAED